MDLKITKIKLLTQTRSLLRLLGVAIVILGAYHMLLPIVLEVPTWAPWREFGRIAAGVFLGDVLLIATGAAMTGFL